MASLAAAGSMTSLAGTPVLTAAAMRDAEAEAVAGGTSLATLMRRAGEGVAEAVRRLAAGADVLVLCGTGNNGGDGWIAAATLARHGHAVRVATPLGEPRTELARSARSEWSGPVGATGDDAAVVVDAVFGTGLSAARPVDLPAAIADRIRRAHLSIAVDVPSGVDSDSGAVLAPVSPVDLTLALGFAKPAHLLQPGAARCGTVRLLSLGLEPPHTGDPAAVIAPPCLAPPGVAANKFTRGMVAVVPGAMAGASLLASEAALRAGAGYVVLLDGGAGAPHALVRRAWSPAALEDRRIGAVLIGNGLGRDDAARAKLAAAIEAGHPLALDGDALRLITPARLAHLNRPVVLTPHEGEFRALFGDLPGSKIDRGRAAARLAGATIVYKGADTVIAAPDEPGVIVASGASDWLSTAGSGDVLAGATAAMLAGGLPPRSAAAAAVWLHGEAARRCGGAFIADDLAHALSAARASA